jgi:chromosome segregation ATPase
MPLNLILLCTAIGALVGTIVGVLLMNRKIRLPITGAELAALRGKLESTESDLTRAAARIEDLNKLLAERDQTLHQRIDEQKQQHERFDQVLAEAEKEKTQRAAAEQKSGELILETAALKEQRAELERQLEEAIRLAEEQNDAHKRQIQALTDQVNGLLAESAALSRFREQESRHRSSLEAELNLAHEREDRLLRQIADLENERSQFDARLQEERQSAARGMELLVMAQENFSRVLKRASDNGPNDDVRIVKAVQTAPEDPTGSPEVLRSTVSVD